MTDEPVLLHKDWDRSGWMSILPKDVTLSLAVVVTTASVNDMRGDLTELYTRLRVPKSGRNWPQDPLEWSRPDQRLRFERWIGTRPMPTTVAEMADLLARLGVFFLFPLGGGADRWRVPDVLPLPEDVLDINDHDREVIIEHREGYHARQLIFPLRQKLEAREVPGEPITVEQLAEMLKVDDLTCLDALHHLIDCDYVSVTSKGAALASEDLLTLPVYARLVIEVTT